VIVADLEGNVQRFTLGKLLPESFEMSWAKKERVS
jgi:hypothetical protein